MSDPTPMRVPKRVKHKDGPVHTVIGMGRNEDGQQEIVTWSDPFYDGHELGGLTWCGSLDDFTKEFKAIQ